MTAGGVSYRQEENPTEQEEMSGTTRKKGTVAKSRRRKLKQPVKRMIRIGGILLAVLLLVGLAARMWKGEETGTGGAAGVHIYKDLNALHLKYAQSLGIAPLKGKNIREQAEKLVDKGKLEEIEDNRYYVVSHLTHSYPYLVPEASDLLEAIGKRFRKKLEEKGMENYYFRITSLLRTNESQRRLRGSNGNATTLSAHLYGTTFDITYKNLVKKNFLGKSKTVNDAAAIRLLSETIGELRKEKKLVVVTEKKEACFHITVRR